MKGREAKIVHDKIEQHVYDILRSRKKGIKYKDNIMLENDAYNIENEETTITLVKYL